MHILATYGKDVCTCVYCSGGCPLTGKSNGIITEENNPKIKQRGHASLFWTFLKTLFEIYPNEKADLTQGFHSKGE